MSEFGTVPIGDAAEAEPEETPENPTGGERRFQLPDWWHRDHPVFGPLAGFYTGMVFIIVVPGAYAAIIKGLFGYQRAEELFPFVLIALAVPLGMLVPHQTRRFARYMLFGCVATLIVVLGVAAAVTWFLLKRDS